MTEERTMRVAVIKTPMLSARTRVVLEFFYPNITHRADFVNRHGEESRSF